MKFKVLILILGFCVCQAAAVWAVITVEDESLKFIQNKSMISSVYSDSALRAYESRNYSTALKDCARALVIDPENRQANRLMKKLDKKYHPELDKKNLIAKVQAYQQQLQEMKLEKTLAVSALEREAQAKEQIAKQNKMAVDKYLKDLQSLEAQHKVMTEDGVKYQNQLASVTAEKLNLQKQANQEFYKKDEVFGAVEQYVYVQNGQLQHIGDLTLKTAAAMEVAPGDVEVQAKLVGQLSQEIASYQKGIQEQEHLLKQQMTRMKYFD